MTPEGTFLQILPALAIVFGLVLCRVGMVVMLMPGLGESAAPMMVRAGLAGCLTILVMPTAQIGLAPESVMSVSGLRIVAMMTAELLAGAVLGWCTRLCTTILPVAGQILSLMTGLSSVIQPDPDLGASASALGRFFSVLAPVLLLSTGLYRLPLHALAGSYGLLPLGSASFVSAHTPMMRDAVPAVVDLTGRTFKLAVELGAPFLLLSLLWQAALALLSRVVPSFQVYNLLMPLEIFGGLALVGVLMNRILAVWLQDSARLLSALPGV